MFADLLRGTIALVGQLLLEKTGAVQMLGGGRRASTLRSRVRAMRRYMARQARNSEVAFLRELVHDVAFPKVRSSRHVWLAGRREANEHTCIG